MSGWEATEAHLARDDPDGHFDRRGKTDVAAHDMPATPRFLPRRHVRVAGGATAVGCVATVVGVSLWDGADARWRSTIRPVGASVGSSNVTVYDDDLEPGPCWIGDVWTGDAFVVADVPVVATHVRLRRGEDSVELVEPVLISEPGWFTLDDLERVINQVTHHCRDCTAVFHEGEIEHDTCPACGGKPRALA